MNVKYDHEANAAYVRLTDQPVTRTANLTADCNIDYDSRGEIVGVELLNVRSATLEASCRDCDAAARPAEEAAECTDSTI